MGKDEQTNIEGGLIGLDLDRTCDTPLHRQLESALRAQILSGLLPSGARLPTSRDLARRLHLSRVTVTDVFETLAAEGYLHARVGRGTFVTPLPLRNEHADPRPVRLSRRAEQFMTTVPATNHTGPPRAFRTGTPDPRLFPWKTWARLSARVCPPPGGNVGYGDAAGHAPLREAIAAYLHAQRGVRCTAEQVLIVSGSQQALDLTARVLLDAGQEVLIEDPGYRGGRNVFLAAGLRLVPTPVDAAGLDVHAGERLAPRARLAYVTPSHQYPLGVVMSAARRVELLEWAARRDAWVLEDDYDSEYRYSGPPLPALQGLDDAGRVVYVGSFSKVLMPALRLGYMVVPRGLIPAFRAAKDTLDRSAPLAASATVAAFIQEGHFARHLRRTRRAYAERHAALLAQAGTLVGTLSLVGSDAGLHLLGRLPDGIDDVEVAREAFKAGVDVNPLSAYALKPGPAGLLLGFAAVTPGEIEVGAQRLRQVLLDL